MRLCDHIAGFTIVLIAVASSITSSASQGTSFGEYHPHTRWIDVETHAIVVDAYVDRLVISQKGRPSITVRGIWRGRAFLKQDALSANVGYFGVAYEGTRAAFSGDHRFERFTFERARPDPK
jgi:hypothetical protein